MRAQRIDRRGDLITVILAAIVAVVGQTVILFNDFGAGNDSRGRGVQGRRSRPPAGRYPRRPVWQRYRFVIESFPPRGKLIRQPLGR
jgi:hypothetical protein